MGIIIMGETGSGKTTVGKILAYNSGLGLYEIGHEVKQVYLEKIQADNLDNEKDYTTTNQRLKFTDDIVEKYGNDYYVKRILKKQDNENIIIIGVRSMAEIRAIKNKINSGKFIVFCLPYIPGSPFPSCREDGLPVCQAASWPNPALQ